MAFNVLDECSVVLLAAGASSRMGTPKGLLDYFGKSWLREQLERLKNIGLQHCVVVIGAGHEQYLNEIAKIRENFPSDFTIDIAFNEHWTIGPFSSVLTGLSHLSITNKKGCFIHLIDVPICEKFVWIDLVRNLEFTNASAASPTYEGNGGHPVYLSKEFCHHLVAVSLTNADARLDHQLRRLGNKHIRLPFETSLTVDNFNTPEQWVAFKMKRR